MSARLARTADGWWLVTPAGLIRLGLTAPTTAALLAAGPPWTPQSKRRGWLRPPTRTRRSRPGRWTYSAR